MVSVRLFDLGGGGLKTSLCTSHGGKIKLHGKKAIGQCPPDTPAHEWLRGQVDSLQSELDAGDPCLLFIGKHG